MKPLDGLRIFDLTEGPAGGLATMILADFGADVVKVERPGGDPFRHRPAARVWLRGKQSVVWDRADSDSTQRLRQAILDSADAVVSSLGDDDLVPAGLTLEQLVDERRDLVVCDISTFGRDNPLSGLRQHDGLVAAKAGRMLSFRGVLPREGPIFAAVEVATHAAAQAAASALIAALCRRAATGEGAALSTSLLRGLLPYEMGGLFMLQMDRREGRTTEAPDPFTVMPTINYHPAQASDGRWLQFGNLLPHLVARFFALTGLDDSLTEAHRRDPVLAWTGKLLEEFRDKLLERMQTRTSDDWMRMFVADGGVVAHPYQTTQQALDDPDLIENGHVLARNGARQLGLVARLTRTPGEASWFVPPLGSTRLGALPAKRIDIANPRRASALPLAGVTVVEFATIIAAPLGVSVLADLGARVIKVEPLEGDPFRAMLNGFGAARVNAGKESVLLDLKADAGRRIAQQLIARADILIHNYRPGVPDKLGIGWKDGSRLQPKLVYVSVNGYGPEGPGALRPSTHPIPGAALGGVLHQVGGALPTTLGGVTELRETARRLTRANELNPDPNTSVVVATAAMLGLFAARRDGVGQQVYVDMFGANAYANFDDFLDYPGKPSRRSLDRELMGLSELYRLYKCRSGWVFLAAELPDEAATLRNALAEVGHPIDEANELERVFARDDAAAWERALVTRGVACVQADASSAARFLLDDPLATAERLAVPSTHALWGDYVRHAALVETDAPLRNAGAPAAGEHTRKVLHELGYSSADIDALLASRAAA